MSVKEAQQKIDSREFAGWMAMELIDGPSTLEREDLRFGAMTCLLANLMMGLWAKRGKRLSIADCTLQFAPRQQVRVSQKELRMKAELWRKMTFTKDGKLRKRKRR